MVKSTTYGSDLVLFQSGKSKFQNNEEPFYKPGNTLMCYCLLIPPVWMFERKMIFFKSMVSLREDIRFNGQIKAKHYKMSPRISGSHDHLFLFLTLLGG